MVDPLSGVPYGEGVNENHGPGDDEHRRLERQSRHIIFKVIGISNSPSGVLPA